ncbi:hypothetical protein [Halorubrum sp. PV6]|uniref:hypothetical protein n=1 Tax=Halorubrum sp. PV6 TaxID=634157 RepID=UPI000F8D0E5D|nr:hypothetical protein [Halorubrum sp. PV6]
MEPPFYHVDRRGDLSVGDTLDINWDLTIYRADETHTVDSQYEGQVREDFQEGLSAHGSRYFHPFYEIDHNREYYLQYAYKRIPTPVSGSECQYLHVKNGINEWLAERTRRERFPKKHSRLQSYFAWPSGGVIDTFGDDNVPVYKVVPSDFELHDMSLLDSQKGIQEYWKGTLTAQPKLEIVMEGPVEVVDIC